LLNQPTNLVGSADLFNKLLHALCHELLTANFVAI